MAESEPAILIAVRRIFQANGTKNAERPEGEKVLAISEIERKPVWPEVWTRRGRWDYVSSYKDNKRSEFYSETQWEVIQAGKRHDLCC